MDLESSIPFHDELQTLLQDRDFTKKLVLWLYYFKKQTQQDISEDAKISQPTVSRIIGRWAESGDIGDKEGRGRSPSIKPKHEDLVIEKQTNNRLKTSASIYREMLEEGHDVSYYQIWSIVNKTFESTYAPYTIKLTADHRRKRMEWAELYLSWRQWKKNLVVWTDEKMFCLYPQAKKLKVKLLPGESPESFSLPKVQQGGGKIMVWGAISIYGKVHLSTLEGKIDSDVYSTFLEEEAIPSIRAKHNTRWMLQQDNAPAHKGSTHEVIEREKIEVMTWPPKSPDLNPIEFVWGWMAKDIHPLTFKNKQELEEYVFELWEKIPETVISSYISNIEKRALYVKEHNGDLCPSHL